jgi:hypothetical protein
VFNTIFVSPVLNKYETAADTHVYKNERDRDEQLEAHAGIKMTARFELALFACSGPV